MASWFSSGDLDILVAVSSAGVYLIEPREGVFYTEQFIYFLIYSMFYYSFFIYRRYCLV
jgi:hypothetical protein